jgi:tetratricopeptide (TPR) repeat protein
MISAVSLSLSKINRVRLLTFVLIFLLALCITPPDVTAQANPNLSSKISEDLHQIHDAEQQHLSNGHRGFLWGILAADYRDAADFIRSEDAYNHSISLLRNAPEAAINYATALGNLGALYLIYARNEEAYTCMKKALVIRRQLGDQINIAMSLQHLADLDIALHRFKDAEKEASQSYQILTSANAPPESSVPALASLAYARCKQNNCALGLLDAQHALEIARATIPPDSLQFGLTLTTLGFVQSRTNHLDDAEKSLLSGIEIVKAQTSPGDPTLLYSMIEYRDYLKVAHRDREAKQLDAQLANSTVRQPCAACSVSVYSLSSAMR